MWMVISRICYIHINFYQLLCEPIIFAANLLFKMAAIGGRGDPRASVFFFFWFRFQTQQELGEFENFYFDNMILLHVPMSYLTEEDCITITV